jgi:hypothetical protein
VLNQAPILHGGSKANNQKKAHEGLCFWLLFKAAPKRLKNQHHPSSSPP